MSRMIFTSFDINIAVQYSERLVGPLIIHGPTVENWDINLGTVLIQDYFHTSIFQEWFMERIKPPVHADNGLINGKNKNGNSIMGEYTEFIFQPGKRFRMRIINTSTVGHFKFSID